ncbi:MAG: AAA family ATPase [Nevskiaceae bacterium]|nr:MAG: AAA family ATPase [Nevskiaceae bacterium]
MYAQYFQLREMPFTISPDPAYLYMSTRHQEALGHLLYGTGQYGGFVQLTGEVGTGKTTVVRTLLEQKLADVDVAMIHNPRQGEQEFVQTVCDELGVKYPKRGLTLKMLVDALNEHLLKAHASGRRTVLIIDEAQNLQPAVLEQVRLLTNLETHKEKLLRIMLVGQPELNDLLARPDLRQLAQRVTARYHLTPLSAAETAEYVRHRLRVAGGSTGLFDDGALREIHRQSGGVPRLINIICDRALLGAYGSGHHGITAEMVATAARESTSMAAAKPRALRFVDALSRLELVFAPLAVVLAGTLIYQVVMDHLPPAPAAAEVPAVVKPLLAPPTPPASPDTPQLLHLTQPLPVVMSRLVKLWAPDFRMAPSDNVCAVLKRKRLECFKDSGKWTDLGTYNRPAILTLQSTDSAMHHVLLRSLDTNYATLDTAMGPQRYPLEELDRLWTGEYLLLWQRDVDDNAIGPDSRGASVLWLRRRLAQLDGQPPPQPLYGFYDAGLRDQVLRFQKQHGLEASGVVRTHTLIALGNERAGTPTLSGASP